jgi:HPt (histidine-containing phosphotransfer) domain-containing protein
MALSIEQAIAEAEKQIRSLADQYPDHVITMLNYAERLLQAGNWSAVATMAHDIKGQAATVGWPILGIIARSLQACIEIAPGQRVEEIIRLHLASMRYCVSHGLKAPSQKGGEVLLADLDDLRIHLEKTLF